MSDRSRAGETDLSVPLMIAAFVAVVGFLWWLNSSTNQIRLEIAEAEAAAAAEEEARASAGVTIGLGGLVTDPDQYTGIAVQLPEVEVASQVGRFAFYLDASAQPFLVKMGPDLVVAGRSVPTGMIRVAGTVHEMTDSVIDAWLEAGAITEEERPVVEFSSYFLEASQIEPLRRSGSSDGADSGD